MEQSYYVYILASRKYGALYVGVTGELNERLYTHREKLIAGHTRKYNITRLVHVEEYSQPMEAITREKRLKKWRRDWKIALIEENNPEWLDLYETHLE